MSNKKINQFPSDVSINGNELILIMDNNVTKKMVAGNFMNFVFDNIGVYTLSTPIAQLNGLDVLLITDVNNGDSKNTTLDDVKNYILSGASNFLSGSTKSISDLGFEITTYPTAILRENVTLPDDSYVTYSSPLIVDNNVVITIPPTSTLTIVANNKKK